MNATPRLQKDYTLTADYDANSWVWSLVGFSWILQIVLICELAFSTWIIEIALNVYFTFLPLVQFHSLMYVFFVLFSIWILLSILLFRSEGGFFNAIMSFPPNYPNSPPSVKFTSELWHPNG